MTKLKIIPQKYILGKIDLINFFAFFLSRAINVFGAIINENRIKPPSKKGIRNKIDPLRNIEKLDSIYLTYFKN